MGNSDWLSQQFLLWMRISKAEVWTGSPTTSMPPNGSACLRTIKADVARPAIGEPWRTFDLHDPVSQDRRRRLLLRPRERLQE